MAVSVRLISFRAATGGNLWPAPNVQETIAWREAKNHDRVYPVDHPDSMNTHAVLWDYRGVLLALEGDVTVFRYAPTTEWVYTSTGFPPSGTIEDVRMLVGRDEYMAQIKFL